MSFTYRRGFFSSAEHFIWRFQQGYWHFGIEAARIQLTDIFGLTPKEANEALLKAMRIPAHA